MVKATIIRPEMEKIMTDIFFNSSSWLLFANAHNKKVSSDAKKLDGSKSYTLAAIYLAAGKEIPQTIRLDTKRAETGRFTPGHFKGLRQYFENGIEPKKWVKNIADECRKFALDNSLDSDELIKNVIKLTDKSANETDSYLTEISKQILNQRQETSCIPTKEDFESAYRTLTRPGESISIDAVLDQIETSAIEKGFALKNNWRMITKKNIEIWLKAG
jgi:hypothetical protein